MYVSDTLDILYFDRSLKPAATITTKPVFLIFDRAGALEFYRDWLGFTIDWEHRFGENSSVYMEVSLNGLAIHLTEHHDDCAPGGKVYIEDFPNLKAFHRALQEKDYRYGKPEIGPAFWDDAITMMELVDPFNNKLVFTEAVPYI